MAATGDSTHIPVLSLVSAAEQPFREHLRKSFRPSDAGHDCDCYVPRGVGHLEPYKDECSFLGVARPDIDLVTAGDAVALLPVREICLRQRLVTAHNHAIFCVPLLSGLGEVKRACEHRIAVKNHDLVVSDGRLGVDYYVYACVAQVSRTGILL